MSKLDAVPRLTIVAMFNPFSSLRAPSISTRITTTKHNVVDRKNAFEALAAY